MNTEKVNEMSQYLTFGLNKELYALDISQVQSIIDFEKITKVPKVPDFMRGVINLRGNVVPVVDLKSIFGIGMTERTIDSCIIIVEIDLDGENTVLGCLADSVMEVIELSPENIEPAPRMGTNLKTDFIRGMGKHEEDKFSIILDLNKVLSTDELSQVYEAGDDKKIEQN